MTGIRHILTAVIVIMLAFGFIAGCNNSSDDGGSGNTGTITGTVTDQNSQPIEGALCTVTTTGVKADYSDTTDSSGVYEIGGIPEGVWPLTVSADGYITQTEDVTIVSGDTTQVPAIPMPVQGYGSVTGTVVSALDGTTPISGAAVSCGGVAGVSGTDGTFTLANVPAGSQTIACTADNYEPYHNTVTVVADTTVTHDISMTPVTTPTTSPTIEPGKGNVTGKVVDANGTGLEGVSVTLQKGAKSTTDSSGNYTVTNLTPGVRTLAYAKTGYDSKTQDVTVTADTTVTATTVTLVTSATTGITTWVSKRVNQPEVNNATDPDVSSDGSKVVFCSTGNVIVNWNNPPTNPSHVYLWSRGTGTVTRLSNNNLVSSSTAGANGASTLPAISGDGAYVVFCSVATDILANGLATTNNGDIFIVKVADNSIARVTNSAANANNGGDAASTTPDINSDGSKVVFSSLATNIGNITHTAAWRHVYYVTITNMSPGVRRMMDITLASAEGSDGGANPTSANPTISYDGRYTAFESLADNITSAGAGVPASAVLQVFRNDINSDPAVGWNIHVSKHDGNTANAACTFPCINEGGTRIAFQSASTNLGNTGATTQNVYLWKLSSASLTYVSIPLSGTVGNSTAPVMDKTGQYVGFLSTTIGLVTNVTDALARLYVKDVDAGQNVYTLVSKGSSDQIPDNACANPALSADGNYAVWDTASKNLTNDTYTTGITDCFIRKWK
ncbi:MAG: carboxypeptidase regulatory-like domain-containing protein [Firmicutes bacterium]|nr:carboxypeptidase regulatory-like domain-containing protein [Bacillota bacterium]